MNSEEKKAAILALLTDGKSDEANALAYGDDPTSLVQQAFQAAYGRVNEKRDLVPPKQRLRSTRR